MANQKMSQNGLDLTVACEGIELKLYNDSAGHCTIGAGHLVHRGPINGDPSEAPFRLGITHEQAIDLLHRDIAWAEEAVNRLVKVPLTQNQFDALVDFTFNLGEETLASSTLLRLLNQGCYSDVPAQFKRFIYANKKKQKGLVKRRGLEAQLFIAK